MGVGSAHKRLSRHHLLVYCYFDCNTGKEKLCIICAVLKFSMILSFYAKFPISNIILVKFERKERSCRNILPKKSNLKTNISKKLHMFSLRTHNHAQYARALLSLS